MVYQLDPKSQQKLHELEEKRFGNKLMLEVGVPKQLIFDKIQTEIRRTASGEGEYFVLYVTEAVSGRPRELITASINLISKLLNELQVDTGDLVSIEKTNRRGADYYKVSLIAKSEENIKLGDTTPPPKLDTPAERKYKPNNDEAVVLD